VVDFLFIIIEHFLLSLMVETLQVEISQSRCFSKGVGHFECKFETKGALLTNHCWCQKTRVNALLCGNKISTVHCLVLSHSTCVTDRWTDRQMNRQTELYDSQEHTSIAVSRGKNAV